MNGISFVPIARQFIGGIKRTEKPPKILESVNFKINFAFCIMPMNQLKLSIHKITHWEYWPHGVVLFPMSFVWIYFAIKAKSLFFFNASNPRIKNAGMQNESKKEIYDIIPQQFIPKTIFCEVGSQQAAILKEMKNSGIVFPCIAKPDKGMKGFAVQKLNSEADLGEYIAKIKLDFLIQEFIDFSNEVGVFYYRLPSQSQGKISGIVGKEFIVIKGNGSATVQSLIQENPRYFMQYNALLKILGENAMKEVLANGVEKNLMPYGNHARGAKFVDLSHWANEEMVRNFDLICKQIPDFYFGRLDIKFRSKEELQAGKNFCIIELNGAGSDPTHIFDPKHSIFYAWKEMTKHYHILYQISIENHRKGSRFLTLREGWAMMKEYKDIVEKLKAF